MSYRTYLRELKRAFAVAAGGIAWALAASAAMAASAQVAVGFDTDNNPATGCTLAIGGSSMPGVEVALTTTIATATNSGSVGSITRRTCVAGAFGPAVVVSAGGWAVGMGSGAGGSDLIEAFLPLADLAGAANVKIGAITAGDSVVAAAPLLLQDPPVAPRTAIPALSPAGLAILLGLMVASAWALRRHARRSVVLLALGAFTCMLTTVSVLAIIYDGNGVDWTGIAPLGTDPAGDAPAGQDLVALYAIKDGANVAVRLDMVLARDPVNLAPVVNAGTSQIITLPAVANLAGSASDDGLPNPPATLTKSWSQLSGPAAGVVFGNPALPVTTAAFQQPGVYMLRLTASDGALSSTSDVQITVNDGAPLLLSVADRTIALGTRFQQLLVARDGNAGDTLTYELLAAPSGALLSPSPLVDWTPTALQLGLNTFTAKVTDSAGHTAQTTFHVTVVHTNHPPQLAPQPNAILPVGAAFSRTLQAGDPDAGDALAFSLVSAPGGMALTGTVLNWPTAGMAPGDYPVSVKVADAGGLFDTKQFTLTLTPAAPPPVAHGDSYEVVVGQTLVVSAPGVLGNDVSYNGKPLTAFKLSEPDKGTLAAFGADGGFHYTAPAVLPPAPGLNPVVSWRWGLGGSSQFALAADFDHNGVVDLVTMDFGNLRAWKGTDGSQLWRFDPAITTHASIVGCQVQNAAYALGDVTGGGDIYLFNSANCDQGGYAGYPDRYFAINASQILPGGKVATQWKSPRLSKPHPGAYATPSSSTLPDPPVTPFMAASASGSVPTLAKLMAGGTTKLLTRFLASTTYGYYYDMPNSNHLAYAACRTLTGLPADEGVPCKATYVIDAATGAIDQVLAAPNSSNESNTPNNTPTVQNIPIVADLDGDGQVEIISGGDVWKLEGGVWTLAWQAKFDSLTAGVKKAFEPVSVAVADLDGDGKAEVILQLLGIGIVPANAGGIYIYNHDGTLRRKIPTSTYFTGFLSVADVDGDGVPEILLAGDSFVYAYRQDGTLLWAKLLSDIINDVVPAIAPLGTTRTTDSPLYVYDLDLDGVPEVIVQGTRRLFILNGRTGAELWSVDTESDGYYRRGNPILVDADGDGHVDILVSVSDRWNCNFGPGTGPVNCKGSDMRISGGNSNWAPGPKVQNQVNFRPGTVNDAGQVLYDASVRRDFRQQIQQGTVIDPRIAQSTGFNYKVNDGDADSAPATVSIAIKPPNRPPVITSVPPTALLNVAPDGVKTIYTISAYDPDPGDTVHYEFVASTINTGYFPSPVVDPVTGTVGLYSCAGCNFGRLLIIVAAVDSHGARAEQAFFVDNSYVAIAVPNVIGLLLPAARTTIEAASLTPRVITETFGPQPAGTVIGQDPLAGAASISRSATVRLTVSKGPRPTVVPFVVGETLTLANSQLVALGFTVAVTPVFSTTIPVNQVITQSPDAGTEMLAMPANPVSLTVSAGGSLPAPIASIVLEPGPGPVLRLAGDELQYKAVAILTDGTSADVTLTAAWGSSLTGAATVSTVGIAKAIAAGATTISASLGGKTGQGTLNVASRVPGDNTLPTAAITSPVDGGAVVGPTPVVGTASDANFLRYELAIASAGSGDWRIIGEGGTAVTNGTLGTLDPTLLLNGIYTLRLTVFDRGSSSATAEVAVLVDGNQKIGYFTLSYTDLVVPLSGIPIQVTRTYDSRDAQKGDFGIGWSLGLKAIRVSTTRELGTGWQVDKAGLNYSLVPGSDHFVSVTLPSGRVESFDVRITPTLSPLVPFATATASFVARPGALGTLRALGNVDLLVIGAQPGPVTLVDDGTLNTFHPDRFLYTQRDGTEFVVRRSKGVESVKDANGNQVTITPGGVTHSAGTSIVLARDAENRITSITDPKGMSRIYSYSGAGDLATTTDRLSNTTSYFYNRSHGLIRIIDPLGRSATRADYDAQGRLIALTDANGQVTHYQHDLPGRQELVEDPLGRITVYNYDPRGNILSIADPLGNTSTFTYDARDNVLTRTNPLGATRTYTYDAQSNVVSESDPLGRTTSFVRDSAGRALAVTDPRGNITTSRYDSTGRLIGTTDALGNVRVYDYDAAGNPTSSTDASGAVSRIEYDSAGRRTRQTNTLGVVHSYQYDANGNLLSQQGATGPASSLSYDAEGRITGTAVGGIPRSIDYDSSGRFSAATTSSNRKLAIASDPAGRLTSIADPIDGPGFQIGYDAVGNVQAMSDRFGSQVTNVFDAADRLAETHGPDGSIERHTHDAAGRLVQVVDVRGNTTGYGYDAAGQVVSMTNALGGQQFFQYDASGNRIVETDAAGQTTRFDHDAANRLVRTTFADGKIESRVHDAEGRLVQRINPAGNSTFYAYDTQGNLLSITDALGHVTRHAYQGGSQRTETTDANGNTTRFAYDTAGRLTATTSPLGSVETALYDSVGNPLLKTNGQGETTQFQYDAYGRRSAILLPGAQSEVYTYTADHLLHTVSDARGTTTLDYDPLTRRVVRVTEPDGRYVRYAHDAAGNKILMAHSDGGTELVTRFAYDALNRLIQITGPDAGITTQTWDSAGNLVTVSRPNGVTTTTTFDVRNRPLAITHRAAGGALIARETCTLDALGNRVRIERLDGSRVEYRYDVLSRVIRELRFDNAGNPTFEAAFAYDAVGNLVSAGPPASPTVYAYNADSQLVSGAGVAFAYDGAGRRTQESWTPPGGAPKSLQYAWDGRDRLTGFRDANGARTTYTYDSRGVRVGKMDATGATVFLVDRDNATGFSQLARRTTPAGTDIFVWGSQLIEAIEAGTPRYPLFDALGSTRLLTGATGAVSDAFDYRAYGQPYGTPGASGLPHRFAGEETDPESGLSYLRARYYDPRTGRFLSRDADPGYVDEPLSLNPYLYVAGNPVNRTDPSGNDFSIASVLIANAQSLALKGQDILKTRKAMIKGETTALAAIRAFAGVMAIEAVIEDFYSHRRVDEWFGGGTVVSALVNGVLPEVGSALNMGVHVAAETLMAMTAFKLLEGENAVRFEIEGAGIMLSESAADAKDQWKADTSTANKCRSDPGKGHAWAYPRSRPQKIELCLSFFLQTPLPTMSEIGKPGASSQPGIMLHEFNHIAVGSKDNKYNCGGGLPNATGLGLASPVVDGFALFNADSYRCWGEASFLGYSRSSLPKSMPGGW